jgi:hypothetical protein
MKPYQKYVHEYDVYGTDMVQIWYRYGTVSEWGAIIYEPL